MALRRRAFCEQDEAELRGRGALVVRVVVRKKAHGYVVLFVSIKEKKQGARDTLQKGSRFQLNSEREARLGLAL